MKSRTTVCIVFLAGVMLCRCSSPHSATTSAPAADVEGGFQQAGPSSLRAYAVRLTPGADVLESLDRFARDRGIQAAAVTSAAGSLTSAVIRMANRNDAATIDGPLEIVALSGTLSPDGPHLHIAVSDAQGATLGGHMMPGCKVRTTLETVIVDLPELRFGRAENAETGFRELTIEPR